MTGMRRTTVPSALTTTIDEQRGPESLPRVLTRLIPEPATHRPEALLQPREGKAAPTWLLAGWASEHQGEEEAGEDDSRRNVDETMRPKEGGDAGEEKRRRAEQGREKPPHVDTPEHYPAQVSANAYPPPEHSGDQEPRRRWPEAARRRLQSTPW